MTSVVVPAGEMLQVLVVEDEPVAAVAHASYVRRVPGFVVAGVARTGQEALSTLRSAQIDLVLLDLHLPDMHGLSIVRAMRAAGVPTDVLAVTSAREVEMVRAAVSLGVVGYLLKPFVFASLAERLQAYREYRSVTTGQGVSTQGEVDQLLAGLHQRREASLPKGLAEDIWGQVVHLVRAADQGRTAADTAQALGVSRVTARRYLEYLADSGLAERRTRPTGTGRPAIEYHWRERPSTLSRSVSPIGGPTTPASTAPSPPIVEHGFRPSPGRHR
ncbi:Response regulator of citrate/malate metabolism [Austwickia chelonae]|uniref:Putative two-component response regulator n=1 Tax=Austwickia chelonae NBRC 105200 TaxID=1184607 RepID=K6UP28_9MICO|nr:response regulator [Austwickia chelonae]GAB79476.1 putative two-component response regulator [Austwickia chelonae NBRC 105200]SEW38498.1 Response regulator of citrate/malate metabolism [Austwickia chelonae]